MNPIEITSVDQFLKETIQLSNSDEHISNQLYYRGEPSDHPMRIPTLYRETELTLNGSERYYRKLINELGRDNNADGASLFRTLSELQHYEAKTRMLDITTNPLVALYFAAEKMMKKMEIFLYTRTKPGKRNLTPAQR